MSADMRSPTALSNRIFGSLIIPDFILSLGFFVLALVLRYPNFMTIPIISDETREILWALDIARGIHLPLTSVDTYDGPVFPYLVALAFRVFGVSSELPRHVVVVIGALTVVATYWLGKVWGNRIAACIGAGLMLTASTHIFVNSHLAWSNAMTPLFTTLCLIALTLANERTSRGWWIAGGALYGLALQTHPSVIVLAPALVLWILARRESRAQLKTAGPYLALGAFLLAYSPLLIHNALHWDSTAGSVTTATRRTYAFGLPENAADYVGRVVGLSVDLLRSFAASFAERPLVEFFRDPILLVYLVLLVVGLGYAFRKGNPLPVFAFTSSLVLLAVFDRRTNFPYDTRYFAFLLPVGNVAVGMVGAAVLAAIARWSPTEPPCLVRTNWLPGRMASLSFLSVARVAVIAFLVLNLIRLIAYPVYALDGVNNFFETHQFTSKPLIALSDRARAGMPPRVWIDPDLMGDDYWMCNGVTAGEALAYLLRLESLEVTDVGWERPLFAVSDWVALTPENVKRVGRRYVLEKVGDTPPSQVHCAPAVVELYKIVGVE